jgi:hypothetical protein
LICNVLYLEPTLVAAVGASGGFDPGGRPTTYRRALELIASGKVQVQQSELLAQFQGNILKAQFSRHDFLKLLPRAQTDAPLAPGQNLILEIDGKMKNGTPLFGAVKVQIADEP